MTQTLASFVSQRKPDWDALTGLLDAQQKGTLELGQLRELDQLYRRATGDLARVQAFYPGTDVHRFLNQLCGRAYGSIYQPPRDRLASVRRFFARDFPRTVRAEAENIWLSAALFFLGVIAGAMVIYLDPASGMRLIPDGVRDSVESGQMWTDSLLELAPPGMVSAAIATNNLTVAILAFASGLLFGLGTLYVMVFNGLHIGSIIAYCIQKGLGPAAFGFVGAHGGVELSIIVLSGGAGLMLGRALLDPGELPRAQHLRNRAREAMKIVIGCAPFLAMIGVVEGYVSPGEEFARPLKIGLGLSLTLLFWSYLLLAGRAHQRG